MHTVKAAKYLEKYCVVITFEDNTTKMVDLADIVKKGKGGIFAFARCCRISTI